jgi:hypothetical protein
VLAKARGVYQEHDLAGSPTRSLRRDVMPLALAQTIIWAAMYYSFPALLPEWERDLGWSKTELSGAFTAALVVTAALAPMAGRLIDRGAARLVHPGGALAGAGLLALLSQVTELWQFYAVWLAMGVAMSVSLYEACFAIITVTIGGRARTAITTVTLVAGFAGTVSFPSAHYLAGLFGWRGGCGCWRGTGWRKRRWRRRRRAMWPAAPRSPGARPSGAWASPSAPSGWCMG